MAATAPSIRIYCLGHFRLERDGSEDALARAQPKPLALLKTLIALGGQNVPEDQLIEALWPDLDGDAAHNAFTSTLYRLRQLIGPEAVTLRNRQLGLDPHQVWWDCDELSQYLEEAERTFRNGGAGSPGDALERALDLYQGPFLEGEFEPPEILAARDKLHSRFLRVMREGAAHLEKSGQLDAAIRLYERGLEADPVAEELCQGLMRALIRAARATEAEAAYQRLKRNLEAMGATPSEETERVRGQAQRMADATTAPSAQIAAGPDMAAPSIRSAHPAPAPVDIRRWRLVAATGAILAVVVIAVIWMTGQPVRDPGASSSAKGVPTVAVLPFENMSGDPEQEYFADGITEDLITLLAQFRDLSVIARLSTFTYKGKAVDVRQVGREMQADFVVEGSVRRTADSVRVTAQLISAADGKHLWAETYDRRLTANELFRLQDEIAQQVARTIGGNYGVIAMVRLRDTVRKPPNALESYDCVLRWQEYNRHNQPEYHLGARTCLDGVTQREPQYADAWAFLAEAILDEYVVNMNPLPRTFERAEEALRRAIRIDPANPNALRVQAWFLYFKKDLAFFEKVPAVIAAAPHDFYSHLTMGFALAYAGKWDEGLQLLDRAIELSPIVPGWLYHPFTWNAYLNGDYAAALAYAKKVNQPGFFWDHAVLAMCYTKAGRLAEARKQAKLTLEAYPEFERQAYREIRKFFWRDSDVEKTVQGWREAGLNIPPEQSVR